MSNWFDDHDISGDLADALFKLRVVLPNKTVIERDLKPDILIDYDMLQEQLEDTPPIFVFWSYVLAEVKKQSAILERAVKRRRGMAKKALLDRAQTEGVKIRVDDIKDIVETDEELNRLEAKLILANNTLSKLFGMVDAVRMKSEHLRSLAGFKRQEQRDS